MDQQNITNNDSSDSTTFPSLDSSNAVSPMIRTYAGTPSTWSLTSNNESQSSQNNESQSSDESPSSDESSNSDTEIEQIVELEQQNVPNFMTGLVIMISLITAIELPFRPVTATLVGVIGLVYNYRNLIGRRNMQILASTGIYVLCAAIWLMFEWQYYLQVTTIVANKSNMFNKFVTTHIQHIMLWPLTIIINFMRRSVYPFISYIGTSISNYYVNI